MAVGRQKVSFCIIPVFWMGKYYWFSKVRKTYRRDGFQWILIGVERL